MIKEQLHEILEIGTNILSTLEDDSLELEKMRQLYEERGDAIQKLDQLALVNDLELNRKKEIQSLFEQLKKQQADLNKKLKNFANEKREALALIDSHKKAKESYSRRAAESTSNNRQIINLKQG